MHMIPFSNPFFKDFLTSCGILRVNTLNPITIEEVRKMKDTELNENIKKLTAAILLNSIFQAFQLKDVLPDIDKDNYKEIIASVLTMWREIQAKTLY